MQINYCFGEEGQAYWTKGHVPLDVFMTEVEKYTEESDDRITQEKPVHCWVRATVCCFEVNMNKEYVCYQCGVLLPPLQLPVAW